MSQADDKKSFFIQQVYLKEINFDAKMGVEDLNEQWEPESKFDLKIGQNHLKDDKYSISLEMSIDVEIKGQVVFNLRLCQVGVFVMTGYSDQDMDRLKKVFCPNILFPYARQIVTQMTTQAGYPPLNLSPIDFETRYQQEIKESV